MAAPEMQFIAREVESLFRAHYSKLVWYAQTLLTRNAQTSDPGRAEEAVQEAFAIAWTKWEDLFAQPQSRRLAVQHGKQRGPKHDPLPTSSGPPACSRPRPRCPTNPSSLRRGPTWNWKVWSPKKIWIC